MQKTRLFLKGQLQRKHWSRPPRPLDGLAVASFLLPPPRRLLSSHSHSHGERSRGRTHGGGGSQEGEGGDAGEPERGAEASAGQSRDHPRSCARWRPRRRPEEAAGEPCPPQRQESRGACGFRASFLA